MEPGQKAPQEGEAKSGAAHNQHHPKFIVKDAARPGANDNAGRKHESTREEQTEARQMLSRGPNLQGCMAAVKGFHRLDQSAGPYVALLAYPYPAKAANWTQQLKSLLF